METLVVTIHVIACVLLVLVVLIQSGKGAEISASFSGSSQTVFGTSGGANFFTRFTAGAATVFMITSLALTVIGGQSRKSLFETTGTTSPAPAQQTAPAAPVAPAADTKAAAPTTPTTPPQATETKKQ